MAKKPSSPTSPSWNPSVPLRFANANQDKLSPQPKADHLDHANDGRAQGPGNPNRTITPTNHKQFNRQKKG